MKLLIASNNAHKIKEFKQIFQPLGFSVTTPNTEGLSLDPAETGTTFAANARLKAEAFAAASGLLTLADDSGLEVDALDKAPGVYSARYGNTAKNDDAGRNELVLTQLAALNLPPTARTGRFRCVIAIVSPDGQSFTVEGTIEGLIAQAPVGENGFGYDPIFWVPAYQKTMAQLPPETKNQISHRAQAAQAAVPVLQQIIMV
jgi:XTP/dITP diphosphohydrolase